MKNGKKKVRIRILDIESWKYFVYNHKFPSLASRTDNYPLSTLNEIGIKVLICCH